MASYFWGIGLFGLGQLPVNWLGFGLVIIAFVLLGLEVTTANNGALAITGVITLVAGLLVLFNSPGSPEFVRISIPSAITIAILTAGFFIFILNFAVRAQRVQPVTGGRKEWWGKLAQARSGFTAVGSKYRGSIMLKRRNLASRGQPARRC